MSAWLRALRDDTPLGGSRPQQKIIDLRAAALLEGDPVRLSALGTTVLNAWQRLGVDDDDDHSEVVRAAVLHRSGLTLQVPLYQSHMRFWIQLRRLRAPHQWFDDPANLGLVSYLNRADEHGYNPFLVLVGLGVGFPDFAGWQTWAQQMPTPTGWPESRLAYLLRRVSDLANRSTGLIAYAQAMEAVFLAVDDPRRLEQIAGRLAVL